MKDRNKYPSYYRLGLSVLLALLTTISIDLVARAYAYSSTARSHDLSRRYDEFDFLIGEVAGLGALSILGYAGLIWLAAMSYTFLNRRAHNTLADRRHSLKRPTIISIISS